MSGWLLLSAALAAPRGEEDDDREEKLDFDYGPRTLAPARPTLGATPGGAQDIAYFRDQVQAGEVPLPAVFTAEGLFSEHDLPLAGSRCEQLLCTNAKAVGATLEVQPDVRYLVQLGFDSGLDAATFRRAPVNLVAVVDKSCSMSDAPITTVRASLREVVSQLGPQDQLAIVLYGSTVDTLLPPTRATNRAALNAAIDRIAIDGSTNLEAGLTRGFEVARASKANFDGVTRVMLFTDERPNTGRTDAEGFMGLAARASADGIGMTTIGVGVQFGAELATRVSSVRGGNLYFFPDVAAMKERFAEDFDTMVTELAHDLVVELTPAAGLRVAGVYGVPGDLLRWTPEGGIALHVPTIFASRDKGALYVALSAADDLPLRGAATVADIRLGFDPLRGPRTMMATPVRVVVPGPGDEGLTRGVRLVDELTTLKRATALHHEQNDQDGAWQLVHGLAGRLSAQADPELASEVALVSALEQTLRALSGRAGEPAGWTSTARDPVTGLPRQR